MKILNSKKKHVKDWTILIYANGNNDLEPEITKALLDIETIGSGEDVNIVVQLGRISKKILNTIRSNYGEKFIYDNYWYGVRRYLVNSIQSSNNYKINSILLEDLGTLNMAKSNTLQEFITWGIKSFKAKKYALIVLGHGSGYMGVSHDFSQRLPNIMTIYGLKRALEYSMMDTNKVLDMLIFDSCYMNTIEVLYEIATANISPKFILTPELSPIGGLPYREIIKVFKDNSKMKVKKLSKKIEENANATQKKEESKLYTYRLNKILFYTLKKSIDKIGKYIINNRKIISRYLEGKYKGYPFLTLTELIDTFRKEKIGKLLRINILILKKVISLVKISRDNENSLSIFLINYDYFNLTKVYYKRMVFSKDNSWVLLLGNNMENSKYDEGNLILQEPMPLNSVYYIISLQNPRLNKTQIYDIIKDLGWSSCPKL